MEILKIYWKKQSKNCKRWSKESVRFVFVLFIHIYRSFFSGHVGGSCRYFPSCSSYALQALVESQSLMRACVLISRRLMRCHPWSQRGGYDPFPEL